MKRSIGLVVIGLASLSLASCGTMGSDIPEGCGNLGTDGPAVRAAAVISAVGRLDAAAIAVADDLEDACRNLATDLGVTIPSPTADQTQSEATCGAVAAEIESILSEAGATITLTAEAPRCSIEVDAYAECAARCDVDVTADVEVMCEPGRLYGTCSGSCSGRCDLEGDVTCAAQCQGTCEGTCSGSCTGECDGTCSLTDESGRCIGTCDGTCMGSCDATCTGSCSGTCQVDVEGSCEGECHGTCDVDFEAPRCDGEAMVMANADCQASCEADLRVDAECTEPRVTVTVEGLESGTRLAALVGAIQARWPEFLAVRARIEAVAQAADDLRVSANALADSASGIGARAVGCLAVAADAAVTAVTSIEVSVSVSVELSASVEG